jgi:hypothetical protein
MPASEVCSAARASGSSAAGAPKKVRRTSRPRCASDCVESERALHHGAAGGEVGAAAALNGLAVARHYLGSLDRVTRVVRLGVFVATSGDVREHPTVADGASELLQDVFGKARNPCRSVLGVASLPLGTPVELELLFEVAE